MNKLWIVGLLLLVVAGCEFGSNYDYEVNRIELSDKGKRNFEEYGAVGLDGHVIGKPKPYEDHFCWDEDWFGCSYILHYFHGQLAITHRGDCPNKIHRVRK